jgi:hypothetical protein
LVPKVVLVSQVCMLLLWYFFMMILHILDTLYDELLLCDDWRFTLLVCFVHLCILAS